MKIEARRKAYTHRKQAAFSQPVPLDRVSLTGARLGGTPWEFRLRFAEYATERDTVVTLDRAELAELAKSINDMLERHHANEGRELAFSDGAIIEHNGTGFKYKLRAVAHDPKGVTAQYIVVGGPHDGWDSEGSKGFFPYADYTVRG